MQPTGIVLKTTEPRVLAPMPSSQEVALSIVVPVMNEEQSVRLLFEKVSAQIGPEGKRYEVIFVDDGSNEAKSIVLSRN